MTSCCSLQMLCVSSRSENLEPIKLERGQKRDSFCVSIKESQDKIGNQFSPGGHSRSGQVGKLWLRDRAGDTAQLSWER